MPYIFTINGRKGRERTSRGREREEKWRKEAWNAWFQKRESGYEAFLFFCRGRCHEFRSPPSVSLALLLPSNPHGSFIFVAKGRAWQLLQVNESILVCLVLFELFQFEITRYGLWLLWCDLITEKNVLTIRLRPGMKIKKGLCLPWVRDPKPDWDSWFSSG